MNMTQVLSLFRDVGIWGIGGHNILQKNNGVLPLLIEIASVSVLIKSVPMFQLIFQILLFIKFMHQPYSVMASCDGASYLGKYLPFCMSCVVVKQLRWFLCSLFNNQDRLLECSDVMLIG